MIEQREIQLNDIDKSNRRDENLRRTYNHSEYEMMCSENLGNFIYSGESEWQREKKRAKETQQKQTTTEN